MVSRKKLIKKNKNESINRKIKDRLSEDKTKYLCSICGNGRSVKECQYADKALPDF